MFGKGQRETWISRTTLALPEGVGGAGAKRKQNRKMRQKKTPPARVGGKNPSPVLILPKKETHI